MINIITPDKIQTISRRRERKARDNVAVTPEG
jgi:hypothetical protein